MNGRLRLTASMIVTASLVIGVAAGCATQSASKMGSGDVVADRQRLMKSVGANWGDIQAKAKAGNIEAIAVNAETLALTAQQIPALFPEGSLTEKSKAKPEVWQKWAEFQAAAKNLPVQVGFPTKNGSCATHAPAKVPHHFPPRRSATFRRSAVRATSVCGVANSFNATNVPTIARKLVCPATSPVTSATTAASALRSSVLLSGCLA